ncbi:MAG: GIY-YIG nuclease family protein [Bacteroidales bacterium]|nr:GIY-YIG nuclease family protein [Bacteroidales bacterium]
MKTCGYIYIITNPSKTVLYTGVTNDLIRRIDEHKGGRGSLFASKYHCNNLVYFERFPSIEQAIIREKQIKKYPRLWKNNLIQSINPTWEDLSIKLQVNPDY